MNSATGQEIRSQFHSRGVREHDPRTAFERGAPAQLGIRAIGVVDANHVHDRPRSLAIGPRQQRHARERGRGPGNGAGTRVEKIALDIDGDQSTFVKCGSGVAVERRGHTVAKIESKIARAVSIAEGTVVFSRKPRRLIFTDLMFSGGLAAGSVKPKEFPRMASSSSAGLPEILNTQEDGLLQEWLETQKAGTSRKLSAADQQILTSQSREFLSLLAHAVRGGGGSDLRTPPW